jgi:hypothetical protein
LIGQGSTPKESISLPRTPAHDRNERRVITEQDRMSPKLPLGTLFTSALMVAVASTSAQATDPGFCGRYARAALSQVRIALSTLECRRGTEGARWSQSFNVHFYWCRSATYEAARAEREARNAHIEACSGRRVP